MNRIHHILFVLIGLFIIISCSRDLNFNLPKVNPLLSIQSFIDSDNEFELFVTMARPLIDQNIKMNRMCQVNIFDNDLFFTNLKLDPSKFIQGQDTQRLLKFIPDSELLFSEGKEYMVEVQYPEFESITGKTVKPKAVKINDVALRQFTGHMPNWYYNTPSKPYSDYGQPNEQDTSLLEFTITFTDPAESSEYYRVGINLITNQGTNRIFDRRLQYAINDIPDPCYMIFNYKTLNPLYSGWVNPATYEILWNDKGFNGENHSFKILVPSSTIIPIGTKFVISLYTLSEDYYKYMIDKWKYSKTENDPFAEPVRLYSNISNGCGIFAFSSLNVDTIIFPKSK
jgi:hypothetical protein